MNLNIGMIGTGSIGIIHLNSLKKIIEDKLLNKYGARINIRGVADQSSRENRVVSFN